ncbi:MAG: radical SAM protein [Fibrobacteres bacterium]|nr:radical SAM protein [Fibrobacterota bacterium]
MTSYKYLFGPLASRRLGMSLGVDLVPHKICNFNCVYCECGETTDLTTERREYIPIFRVLDELKDFFKTRPEVDYITFSGAGEPLLNKGIGGVVNFIKQNYPGYKTALLTNSAFLVKPEVRAEIMALDLIVPSLDAITKSVYQKINRCDLSQTPDPISIIESLVSFRQEFKGQMWLEIFIVPGVNDSLQELDLLSKAAERIKPDKVQINGLDRPGTEDWVRPMLPEEAKRVISFFKRVPVELVTKPKGRGVESGENIDRISKITALISRRPSTLEDISHTLGLSENETSDIMDALIENGSVTFTTEERGVFFRLP